MQDQAVVGQIPTGQLTTISVWSAKVAIKMVKLSNYFGKNLWCVHLLKGLIQVNI